jgi:hypothetical protein
MVTLAPATAAPFGSETVPRRDVEDIWENTKLAPINRNAIRDSPDCLDFFMRNPLAWKFLSDG